MKELELEELASQLRRPEGEAGKKVGLMMNEGNSSMNELAIETLNLEAGDDILEIGQGNGYFVKDILSVDESIRYTGVDFSEVMVKEAETLNKKWVSENRADFHFCDAVKLPFKDHAFNKIFTVNTLYFWEDPESLLSEIKRVLRKDGEFYLVFRPKSSMSQLPFTRYGFKLYDPDEAKNLLISNKMQIIKLIESSDSILAENEDWGVDEFDGKILIIVAK